VLRRQGALSSSKRERRGPPRKGGCRRGAFLLALAMFLLQVV